MANLELITSTRTQINLDHDDDSSESDTEKHPEANTQTSNLFLYNTSKKPTCIEKLFGEPFHVKDEYTSYQITIPFVLTLFSVYAVEGCMDWLFIAIRYYGAAVHNIGPHEMQNFMTIFYWSWNVKIIYGLATDALPIFGYKRKSYMLIFGILAPVSMFIAVINPENYNVLLAFMTINSFSICFCDVIADALTIERTQFKSHTVATRLQCLAWGSRSVAVIIGSITTTSLVEKYGGSPDLWIYVFWSYLAINIPIGILAFFVPEKRQEKHDQFETVDVGHNKSYSVRQILSLTYQTLCRKSIFYPLLFMFLLDCTPTGEEGIMYFLIYGIGFAESKIGILSVAAQVSFLLSIAIITYQSRKSNPNFSLRKLFFWWTLWATFLPCLILILIFRVNIKWGISDEFFMISDRIVIRVASYMLYMGTNVLIARICPIGIEGIFMTVVTSLLNIGTTVSYTISAQMLIILNIKCVEDPNDADNLQCNFDNLWIMVVIVNLTSLIPLILIRKVPNEKELQIIGEKLSKSSDNTNDNNEIERSEMIGIYWFIKKLKCCCSASKNNVKIDS